MPAEGHKHTVAPLLHKQEKRMDALASHCRLRLSPSWFGFLVAVRIFSLTGLGGTSSVTEIDEDRERRSLVFDARTFGALIKS